MSEKLATTSCYVVVRSSVPKRDDYNDYEQELRLDFWFSCAYCTLCEAEAQGISFSIDHYEPQKSRRDLINEYSNLMYSCTDCNSLKWKFDPPVAARKAGLRYFKADEDDAAEHFELRGNEICGKTQVGEFTTQALDLNRESLLRLRDLRRRLAQTAEGIAFGMRELRKIHVDRMSAENKLRFGLGAAELSTDKKALDAAIKDQMRSPLLDVDSGKEARTRARRAQLREWRALFPDPWWKGDDKAPEKAAENK